MEGGREGRREGGWEFSAFLAHLDTTEFTTPGVRNLRGLSPETKDTKHASYSLMVIYVKNMSELNVWVFFFFNFIPTEHKHELQEIKQWNLHFLFLKLRFYDSYLRAICVFVSIPKSAGP